MKKCLCIDVGGTSIKYALIDDMHEISNYGKISTPYEGVEKYIDCLTTIYHQFSNQVYGIGMSVPGIIDSQNGICITGGNLTYADGLDLVDILQKKCEIPVTIMNDGKCAALAEASLGSLSDVKDSIVIVFGTAVGGALIKDGKVHEGGHFSAGEFSYLAMNDDIDSPDNLWWGVNGIQRLIIKAARIKEKDSSEVNGELIFQWIEEGDQEISQLLDEHTKKIARMIMNLQFIFDPEKIAIGGGISRQTIFIESIKKNLDYLYKIYPYKTTQAMITNCQFYNEANLVGAYINYTRNS
ncbi:ROK family protein [Enterococcus hulanensis]|uniref:ROK family protein n=1 Tax=Enterococcus hulanensis TaxID=2559929 RepID=UPI001A8C256E|nr:ROK family protein [Enterococcus hulanensis]